MLGFRFTTYIGLKSRLCGVRFLALEGLLPALSKSVNGSSSAQASAFAAALNLTANVGNSHWLHLRVVGVSCRNLQASVYP